jgi:hypothetical protein
MIENNMIENLVSAAKEFEISNEINWDGVNIDRDTLYESMAITALEIATSVGDQEEREVLVLSTLTSLLVQNVILKLGQNLDAQDQTNN